MLSLDVLERVKHAKHCLFCLMGLPATQAEADSSRVAIGFYALGSLDLLGLLDDKTKPAQKEAWREWIWDQQVSWPASTGTLPGVSIDTESDMRTRCGGFRPGPFMDVAIIENEPESTTVKRLKNDMPHLIMTYTALLSLAILRDDFSRLDRKGLINLLRASQNSDGSFTSNPGKGEADLRTSYTAFAISEMLNDWSGIDVPRALDYISRCEAYEGGYGQQPGNEAQGGPTYCALASLALAPLQYSPLSKLSRRQARRTTRWLILQPDYGIEYESSDGEWVVQEGMGGFGGRTGKLSDVCYSFWCGAALKILSSGLVLADSDNENGREAVRTAGEGVPAETYFIDRMHHAKFLAHCQSRMGGLGKNPGAQADPYHTYLGLAALSIHPPLPPDASVLDSLDEKQKDSIASWELEKLDPLINATKKTARWAKENIPARAVQ